ncbi:hypothetical protein LBMAG49_15580 [Planctomycetota bacterium]|nr:hypothetical protein LBMAG49_15580 [Planctomycetota bacterium]
MALTATNRFLGANLWLLALASAGVSCSGGGSGGPPPERVPPILVAAAFSQSFAQPDRVLLTFSESVHLTSSTVTDLAWQWSNNGSLFFGSFGTDPLASVQPDSRSILVTLGVGYNFTPGLTQLDLASNNRTIADLVGNIAVPSIPKIIGNSDGRNPRVDRLTINDIDDELNGTGPAGGMLQVPENQWRIDLEYSDQGLGIDLNNTQLLASVNVSSGTGIVPAGTNLLGALTPVTINAGQARYMVPSSVFFPDGQVTLTCIAVDLGGLPSETKTLPLLVRRWTDARRPFETTAQPSQVWFLDTSRDIESYTLLPGPNGTDIHVNSGANGRADFLDVLFALGLQTTSPQLNVQGSQNSNEVVIDQFNTALSNKLNSLFESANVTFTFIKPPGSFQNNAIFPYPNFGYSQISVSGSAETVGVLGIAQIDPNNQSQNNNSLLGNNTQARLGVFMHTIAQSGIGPGANSSGTFHFHFDPFANSAIGTDSNDRLRLTGGRNDARADQIDRAILGLSCFTAVVIAHECGHSMGLVIDGAPPIGLYGGDTVNFRGSTSAHIKNGPPMFPSGINVMSPALGYDQALDPNTRFNRLNKAYLREQVSYGN